MEWDNVLADDAGKFTLTFRYAAADAGPCDLFINGSRVGRVNFAATGGLTNWKTEDISVQLKKGSNVIKVQAIAAGPNLDAMAVNEG